MGNKMLDLFLTVALAAAALGPLAVTAHYHPPKPPPSPPASYNYTLPNLTYATNALEPFIDNLTMVIHHSKHHQAYITNLNTALAKYPYLLPPLVPLVDLNRRVGKVNTSDALPADIATAVRNNGGGHFNHAFFWKVMAPPGMAGNMSHDLKEWITKSFGSVDNMKVLFNATALARFGSGWTWLGRHANGSLIITSTANQDNPIQSLPDAGFVQHIPILALDVWEHAYYLKNQNRRADYIMAWWNVVNWAQVSSNFAAAKMGQVVGAI